MRDIDDIVSDIKVWHSEQSRRINLPYGIFFYASTLPLYFLLTYVLFFYFFVTGGDEQTCENSGYSLRNSLRGERTHNF